jgi:hypothetical protein
MRRLTIALLVLSCFSCTGCNVKSVEKLLGLGGDKNSVTVVVDPKTQSVVVATAQQFIVTVTGSSNMAVAWSVGGTNCSTQDCGTISAAGLYTAPTTIPNPALVAVTATANANSADFGAAAVTIIAAHRPCLRHASRHLHFPTRWLGRRGLLTIGGAFEADGSGQLLNGKISLAARNPNAPIKLAGATASTDFNNGTFAADIFPASTFTFSRPKQCPQTRT